MPKQRGNEAARRHLPIAKKEDVEFSLVAADEDDIEALARATEAEQRAEKR
ncbi:MAG TPA: YfhD family protein [Bacilli bacterium]